MAQQDVFSPVPEHRAPLRATSGNAQMIDRDTKRFNLTKLLQRRKSVTVRRYSPYPKPPYSLKSEPVAQTPASHLQNESYLDYLARKRQDRGQDGKPIWSAEVEESFQDGMICLYAHRPITDQFSLEIYPAHREKQEMPWW